MKTKIDTYQSEPIVNGIPQSVDTSVHDCRTRGSRWKIHRWAGQCWHGRQEVHSLIKHSLVSVR